MNILPKKRWHVRTKENIARVRKDEAEAAEKERQEALRIETSNREARLHILKLKSKQKLYTLGIDQPASEQSTSEVSEHINLFIDVDHAVSARNKEHDKELKEKEEEYQKKIGYLTYLGQDTNESLNQKNWYEVAPSARFAGSSNIKDTYEKLILKDEDGKAKKKDIDVYNGEYHWKSKQQHDPINKFRKYCKEKSFEKKKLGAKHVHSESSKLQNEINKKEASKEDKMKKLQKLRESRLRREQEEKYKTDLFLSGFGKSKTQSQTDSTSSSSAKIKPKYNSQFNPELARQNFR